MFRELEPTDVQVFQKLYDNPLITVPRSVNSRIGVLLEMQEDILKRAIDPNSENTQRLIGAINGKLRCISEEFEMGLHKDTKDMAPLQVDSSGVDDKDRDFGKEFEYTTIFVTEFYDNSDWETHEKRRLSRWKNKRSRRSNTEE